LARCPSAPVPHQTCATSVAAIVLDRRGVIVSADAETERLTGHAPEQLAGRSFDEALVVPAERGSVRAALNGLESGAVIRLAVHLRGPDETTPAIELTVAGGERLGAAGLVLVTMRDLDAQRLAEYVARAGQAVIGALARAESPECATRALLAALADRLAWAEGTYWTFEQSGTLSAIATWPREPSDGERASALASAVSRSGGAEWTSEGDPRPGLAVPVRRDGTLVGVLELRDTEPRDADPVIAEALTTVGAQIGELLGGLEERFTLTASLTRLALTDQLTGVPNRRAWEDALTRELARSRRSREPVCIAVIDLDEFKAFNDEHGHQAGDQVLTETARAWKQQLRVSDILARYGGEEFAALIPAWPMDRAVEVVDRVRGATPGGLTASAGVACWDGLETGAALFGRADAALYEAKQQGRNRTVAAALNRSDEATAGDGERV
jgi:diguanylate cyclase (GGDEF)-like protein